MEEERQFKIGSREGKHRVVYRREYMIKGASKKDGYWGFPGGAVVESLPANARDTGSRPGLGRSHMPRSN